MNPKYGQGDIHRYRMFVREVNDGANQTGASAAAEVLINNLRVKITVEAGNPYDATDILLRGLALVRGNFDAEFMAEGRR